LKELTVLKDPSTSNDDLSSSPTSETPEAPSPQAGLSTDHGEGPVSKKQKM